METIRSEIAQLRATPLRMGTPYGAKLPRGYRVDRDTCWQGAVTALTDPSRVKKLTSFFGDEPPLLRIFLKKLGYEVFCIKFWWLTYVYSCDILFYRNTPLCSIKRKSEWLSCPTWRKRGSTKWVSQWVLELGSCRKLSSLFAQTTSVITEWFRNRLMLNTHCFLNIRFYSRTSSQK